MHLKYLLIIFLMPIINHLLAQSLNFEVVNIEKSPTNALRANVFATLSEPAHVYVQFAYTENGELYTETSAVSAFQKEHDFTLIALRDNTLYQFRVFAFNKQNRTQSQLFELTTPVLPLMVENFESPRVNRLENRQTYTINNTMKGNERYFYISDTEGRLVWYSEYPVLHNVCNGWRWTEENTILQADCRRIREVDLLGNVLTDIVIYEPEWNLHHDVMRMRDGNIIAIYTKPEIADLSQTVGIAEAKVAVDGYFVVNPEGEIIENWSASDHFDIQTAERKGAYWNFIYGSGTVDWCHFNALEEDIDGSILISVSHWSRILKVDRLSGEVMWQLGDGGTLRVPPGFVIRQQHAITTLAPNRYLIFDNLGYQGSSRAMEFAVETNDNRAFQFWEYVPQPNIVSLTRGNAQRLTNGNTLIFFPTSTGIIQEVDEKGELLWEVKTLRSGYRAYRIPYINEPHPEIRFVGVPDSICANAEPIEINTMPENGYLNSEAMEDGMFNPQKANIGANKIFASFGTSRLEIQFIEIADTFQSYQWYVNDTLIKAATRPQYQPEASGLYYVKVLNQQGCTAISDTLNYIYVNISENFDATLELTQVENQLMINHPKVQTISVEIFNLQGQKIEEQQGKNNYQINTTQFPSMYLVRVFNGNQFRVEKMLNFSY